MGENGTSGASLKCEVALSTAEAAADIIQCQFGPLTDELDARRWSDHHAFNVYRKLSEAIAEARGEA